MYFKGTRMTRINRILIKLQAKNASSRAHRVHSCDLDDSCSKKNHQFVFKRTRIKRIIRLLIKHLKQETQAAEPTGLIRAIWMIRVLKKISSLCLKEHEYSESTEC